MKISVTPTGLDHLLDDLGKLPGKIDAAGRRAVSRTVDGTGTQARRKIAAATGMKTKRIARRLKLVKPKTGALSGRVWIGLLPIAASYIEPTKPRGVNPRQQRRLPGSTAGAGKFIFPGAFIARMPNGHMGIFRRATATDHKSPGAWTNNLPIIEQRLTAGQLGIADIGAGLQQYADDRLRRELSHELGRALGDRS